MFMVLMLLPTLAFGFGSPDQGKYLLLNSSNDEVFLVDTVDGKVWLYLKSVKRPMWTPTIFQCEKETYADNPDCDDNKKLPMEIKTDSK